jgi:hypothetical protein
MFPKPSGRVSICGTAIRHVGRSAMRFEPSQLGIDLCPRAGHGCARERAPVSLAAGWDLVQRDWGLRQREPGSPGTVRLFDRTRRLASRLGRQLVRLAGGSRVARG